MITYFVYRQMINFVVNWNCSFEVKLLRRRLDDKPILLGERDGRCNIVRKVYGERGKAINLTMMLLMLL